MTTSRYQQQLAVVALAAVTIGAAASCGTQATGDRSAEQKLDSLRVASRPADVGTYRRTAFGAAWSDVDGNHCRSVRCAVSGARPYPTLRGA